MSLSKTCYCCKETKDSSLYYKGRNQCKGCTENKRKCIHGIRKERCKECGGSEICIHNKRKEICTLCAGSQVCVHNKIKAQCKECGGNKICNHNRRRDYCIDCAGSQICEHYIQKAKCKECGGGQICNHFRIKSQCKECGGSSICSHNIQKSNCIICNPKCACIDCKSILVDKRSNNYPFCQACFCNRYPDHEKSTLYKIKERYLRDELRVRFPDKNINMIFDKAIDGGCSKKRPDVLIDLLLYSIIIECDENQHKNYECENKRMMQLFEDLGERPLIMIRFNPDSYTENNKKVKGCFNALTKIEDIHKRRFYDLNKEEWKRRIDILEEVIRGKISEDIPKKEVEEIRLFYDF